MKKMLCKDCEMKVDRMMNIIQELLDGNEVEVATFQDIKEIHDNLDSIGIFAMFGCSLGVEKKGKRVKLI